MSFAEKYRLKTTKELAFEYGVNRRTIYYWAKHRGLQKIKRWTKKEDTVLLEMRSKGMTYLEIASKLERTCESVSQRTRVLKARS